MSASTMPLPGVLDGKQPAPGKGGFTPAEEHAILAKYYLRADRFTKIALGVHFVLALAIAECYDTWLVTIPVAVAAVALFLCSSALLPGAFLTRCTAGVSLAIFVTLHIYQMHGLPEMHFLFFTTLTILIAYCDWKAMWPATLYIVVQHVTFAWLTNQGSEVFFFPESYVDATKLSFHFGFAGAQAVICGVWACSLRQQILRDAREHGDKVRRLALVAEKTQNAVVVTDADGIITWVNESFTRVTGYLPEEAVCNTKPELLHGPDTDPRTGDRIRQAIHSGEPFCGEVYNYTKDGRGYWLSLSITPLKDEANHLEGFIAIETDLTEQKRAAEAIRLREERFELAFQGSSEGLWDWNLQTNEVYYSPRYKQMLGYTEEEFQFDFETWKRLLHPEDSERTLRVLQAHLDHREPYDVEFRLRTKCGVYCWFHVRGEARRDETGRATRMTGSISDISDRKRAEAELLRHAQDSYDARCRIEEQAALLVRQTEELHLAQLRAESANSAKSNFLANMSHEIRTPMSAIIGHAELLVDPTQSPAQRNYTVQSIQRNSEHLLQLVNDVLDLSKIEAGKMDVELIQCSPCQIVADVASMMRVRSSVKGLRFDVEYVGRMPEFILSDPTRVRQILVNLVSNAIKFTTHGSLRISCRFDRETDPNHPKLRFDVIDTGSGMTVEQVARLFQPFMQADTSTTRKFGGTGLGLTISKRLAQMLGGDLTVQTELGYGSRFTLIINTGSLEGVRMIDGQREGVSNIREVDVAPVANDEFESLRGCSVLLAEDGEDNQYLITLHLSHAGVKVDVAENGRLAVEKVLAKRAADQTYDVILMDMQMPELDGYSATAEVRRQGYTGPIVALTAHAMSGDREKCLAAGCDDYCSKPISRARLLGVVAKYLRRDEPRVAPALTPPAHAPSECTQSDHVPHEHTLPDHALSDHALSAPTLSDQTLPVQTLPVQTLRRIEQEDPRMQELILRYVGRLQDYAGQFPDLLAAGDRPGLKRLTHQVRGSAGGYGFDDVSASAARLEEALLAEVDALSLELAVYDLSQTCCRASSFA